MTRVLYCGDTAIFREASYLASLMTSWGWEYDYVPSDAWATSFLATQYDLYVFSDYPSTQLSDSQQIQLLKRVEAGSGLLMIGGWESFHGLGGDWDETRIGQALPVSISSTDDRVNADSPVLVQVTAAQHPIAAGLPWNDRPPLIGGFNQFSAKPDSATVLQAVRFRVRVDEQLFRFQAASVDPLLVTGTYRSGRTACLATDVAPHWVGPLVDWGEDRISVQAPNTDGVEVGGNYAQLFKQLLSWTANSE